MDTVLLEKLPDDSRIAVLTVNRPEVLNALNDSVMEGLAAALDALEGDASVKAVILTGAGERAFVAGADISEFAARSPAEHYAVCMAAHGLFSRLETLDKVTIAAVGGWALGGGCELSMCCDLRVASANAVFGLPEVTLGTIPGYGGTQRLARLVGMGRAKELIYTAGRVDARRAYEIGLVNRVVETHDELLPECVKLARGILKNSFSAVTAAKHAVFEGAQTDLRTGLAHEAALAAGTFSDEDMREGVSAFLEKRKPDFCSSKRG